jgi:coenzyme PQQ precursor peptide PqqA
MRRAGQWAIGEGAMTDLQDALFLSFIPPCSYEQNASKRHLRLRALRLYHLCERSKREDMMAWTTPVLVEICVGLEINGYLPPEF